MPRPKTAAATYERLTLRLPAELLEALQSQADTIGRPMNTHVVRLLQAALARSRKRPSAYTPVA